MGGQWENEIFGCFDDLKLCALTYILPCFTVGKIAEKVTDDDCFMGGCKTFIPIYNISHLKGLRDAVRNKKGIDDEGIMGWVFVCCLGLCSIVQEAREIGIDNPLDMGQGETIERVYI